MIAISLVRRITAAAAAVLIAVSVCAAATPREAYTAALAREQAWRAAVTTSLPSSELLAEGRRIVAAYEAIVRAHPTSGYSDDALWAGAHVSADLFSVFGEPRDQAKAVRLFATLSSQYPSSKFAARAAAEAEAIEARNAVLAAPKPAIPAAPATTAPVNPKPSSPADAENAAPSGATAPETLATVTRVRRATSPEAVRITLELDREVAFHDERIDNPSRVFLDLTAARPAAGLGGKTIRFDSDADIVRQVRIGRRENDVTRVVLDTVGVSSYTVTALYNPFRLIIDCARTASPPAPAATSVRATTPAARAAPPITPKPAVLALLQATIPAPMWLVSMPGGSPRPLPIAVPASNRASAPGVETAAAEPSASATVHSAEPSRSRPSPLPPGPGFSIARQLGLSVSRIVIDPGHGGHDPGAKGKGLTEAELVLDVALRLEKLLLKTPGNEVILTRRSDDFVPLPERTAIANRENADLFLSIHANASPTPEARGIETFFLNFASNLSAAAVAARENAASGQSMGALPDFVKAIALNNKLDESREFAAEVQRALVDRLKPANKTVKNLGVKQAPFVVLIGASMPSVLAEISFITNPQEEKLLRNSAYRDRIAEALLNAISQYQRSLQRVTTVAHQ